MTQLPTDLQSLRRLDLAHHLPAQQNYRLMQKLGGSRIITRAEGCYIHDADGSKLLDGMAGLWCVNVGYGRAELAALAHEQMLQLPFYNTFFRTATVPAVQLAARKIAELTGGDAAARVLQQFRAPKPTTPPSHGAPLLGTLRGQPQRKIFISRWNAYHGSTVAGASLGRHEAHACAGRPADPRHRARHAALQVRRGFGETREAFAARAADALEQRILRARPGARRGVHRRAGAGCRRRDHPTAAATGSASGASARSTAFCWSPTR